MAPLDGSHLRKLDRNLQRRRYRESLEKWRDVKIALLGTVIAIVVWIKIPTPELLRAQLHDHQVWLVSTTADHTNSGH
jgi:hypothetical protein